MRIEPPPGSDMPPFIVPLSPGDAGVIETLAAMSAVARDAAESPAFSRYHEHAGIDPLGYSYFLFTLLKARVDFQRDPARVEWVQHPAAMLAEIERKGVIWGDCDDRALLGVTIALASGYQPYWVVIGQDAGAPFQHVYFGIRGGLVIDPQETNRADDEAPHVRRLEIDLQSRN